MTALLQGIASSGKHCGGESEKGRVTPPPAPSYVMHSSPDNGGAGSIANSGQEIRNAAIAK